MSAAAVRVASRVVASSMGVASGNQGSGARIRGKFHAKTAKGRFTQKIVGMSIILRPCAFP